MLTISKSQIQKLGEIPFMQFVNKMQKSIRDNLAIEQEIDKEDLVSVINTIMTNYRIIKEEGIEDFLLLYYHFPLLQNDPLPAEVVRILKSRTKKEAMKLEQLTQYCLTAE